MVLKVIGLAGCLVSASACAGTSAGGSECVDPRPELDSMFGVDGDGIDPHAALELALRFGEFAERSPDLARDYVARHMDDARVFHYISSPAFPAVLPPEILMLGLWRLGADRVLVQDGELSDAEREWLADFSARREHR